MGDIKGTDFERMKLIIEDQNQRRVFHWPCRSSSLFARLISVKQVLFDITSNGRIVNVEPYFD